MNAKGIPRFARDDTSMWSLRILIARLRPFNTAAITKLSITVIIIALFLAGDFVLLVDGQEIGNESWDSIKTIQDAIKKHQPGEPVRFRIRRASGILEEVPVTLA